MSLGDIGRAIDGDPNSSGVKLFPNGSESVKSNELSSGTGQTSSLITGNSVHLTSRDVENRASYEGQSLQLGGGVSFGGGKADGKSGGKDGDKDQSNIGTDGKGEVAGGSKATPNSKLASANGISMGLPVIMGASGQSSSTTLSGISGGTVVIRDEAGQKGQTGQTAAEVIAGLNRDTTDTLNSLDPIFNEKEIRAGFEIVGEAGRQVGQFLVNRAREIEALKARAKDETLSQAERAQAAAAAEKLDSEWGPSGSYRRIVSAISAAAAGNVTGSAGGFVQAAAVNYLQGLGASQVKKLADSLGDGGDSEAARALLHGIVGCAGAAASGGNCSAGALGAAASSVLAKLLEMAAGDDLSAEEREARGNLVASVVAGISEMTSVDATTSTIAAVTELSNNALTLSELKRFGAEASTCEALGTCDQVQEKFRKLSIDNQETMIAVCAADPNLCRERYGEFVERVTEYREELDKLIGTNLPAALKNDAAIYFLQHAEAVSLALHTEIAADLQKRYGVSTETAARLVAAASAVAGSIKGAKSSGAVINVAPMIQRVLNVRAGLPSDLRRSGNVAVAEIDIPGIPKQMAAHSRVSEAGKGLIGSGNGLFTAQTVPNKAGDMVHRGMDTEYKIFDNIAGQLGNNTSIRGTVNILTEKAACASCLNVAEQFKAKYPNVEVNIFDNQGVMLRPPRRTQ